MADNQGALDREKLLGSGMPPTQVDQWERTQRLKLLDGGMPTDQIDTYFATPKPDTAGLDGKLKAMYDIPGAKTASNPWESFVAGGNLGSMGSWSGKPEFVQPQNADWLSNLTYGMGMAISDLPANVAGFFGGAAVGSETGPGAGLIGIGAAAFLPSALREVRVDQWEHPDGVKSPQEFWARVGTVTWNTVKETAVGAIGGKVGEVAGTAAEKTLAPVVGETVGKFTNWAANALGFATAATATGAALEGRMPTAQDFTNAAVMALGFNGAAHIVHGTVAALSDPGKIVEKTLKDLYVEKGIRPDEALRMAANDPVLQQELLTPRNARGDWSSGWDKAQEDTGRVEPVEAPLKTEPPKAVPGEEPQPSTAPNLQPEDVPPVHVEVFQGLGLDPRVAEAYGFDPGRLSDPAYAEEATRGIVADLSNKFNGDLEDMTVAWAAGAQRARLWVHDGRDFNSLRPETQRVLLQAEEAGAFGDSTKYADADFENQLGARGVPTSGMPAAGGGSGGKKPPLEGEIIPPGEGPQKRIEGRVPTIEERLDSVRDIIAPEARKTNPLHSMWRGFTHLLDTIESEARRQDKAMGFTGRDYGVEDMKRQTFGTRNRIAMSLAENPVELSFDGNVPVYTQTDIPSRTAAARAVAADGGNWNDFLTYWMSKHIDELEAQGTKSGATPEQVADARAIVSDAGLQAKYERGLAMMQENKNAALDYAHSAGFWTEDQYAALRDQFRSHMYWGRALSENYEPTFGFGGGRLKPAVPGKKQVGSSKQVNANPFERDMDNSALMLAKADQNVALRGMIDTLVDHERAGAGEGFSPVRDTATESALGRDLASGRILRGELLDEDGKPIPLGTADRQGLTPLLADKWLGEKRADRFIIWRDGVPEVWKATSPEMADLMRLAGPEIDDPISNTFKAISGLSRLGIVGELFFGLRTMTYGQWTAWVQGGRFPYVGFMEGMFSRIVPGMKGMWTEAQANGALTDAAFDIEKRNGKINLDEVFEKSGAIKRVFNAFVFPFRHPLEALRTVSGFLHNSSAVGDFAGRVRRGVPPAKAAAETRRAFIDPAERMTHNSIEWWTRVAPFVHATILDAQATARALNPLAKGNAANAAVNITKLFLGMTAASLANNAVQYAQDPGRPEEKRFANMPRWLRDNYWNWDVAGHQIHWKAPPSPMTWLFKVLPERVMEYALTQNPRAFEGLDKTFMSMTIPQLLPVAALPPLEAYTNYDIPMDHKLVPDSLSGQVGWMQYSANTTETAKAIARIVGPQNPTGSWGWSPIVIENWFREWGGTVPYQLLRTVEGKLDPVKSSSDAANLPFVGQFFVRNYGAGQMLDDFYDATDKWATAHKSLVASLKHANPDEIAANTSPLAQVTSVDIGGGRSVSIMGARKAVAGVSAVMRAIDGLPSPDATHPSQAAGVMKNLSGLTEKGLNSAKPAMTPDEKRLAIDTLAGQLYSAMKPVVKALDELANRSQQ